MSNWGIAEWYGKDLLTMSPADRRLAAERAIAAEDNGVKISPQPECPFLSAREPGALCNKVGGVCSIRRYEKTSPVTAADTQPTTTCPNRFLEYRNSESIFNYIAREFFSVASGAKMIPEVPFLRKEMADGGDRGAKAGRIDWILVPRPVQMETDCSSDWLAIETQAVYFSGDKIRHEFDAYYDSPDVLHFPVGRRRPDYRSSGAKRLLPQLEAKAPVMNRWGKKVVVIVDAAFFSEFSALDTTDDFDNSEIVWVVVDYGVDMVMRVRDVHFAELRASVIALQAARPVSRGTFEGGLQQALLQKRGKRALPA